MWTLLFAPLLLQVVPPTPPDFEDVRLPVIQGGDFAHGLDPDLRRLPWWRHSGGEPRLEGADRPWLVLVGDARVEQPFALDAPSDFAVEAELWGSGWLEVVDGRGGRARAAWDQPEPGPVRVDRAWFERELGRPSVPRYLLVLGGDGARWRAITAHAEVRAPTRAALSEELVQRMDRLLEPYFERSLDRFGPRETTFIAQFFDADTGEPAGPPLSRVGYSPLYERLLAAYGARPLPRWEQRLIAYLEDFLELCLHPETGLPRTFDPVADRPADGEPIEIAAYLRLLLDAAEFGPPSLRERCRQAARRMGEWVLVRGVLPTGEIAPKYRPADGQPFTETPPLRRLDVPAQLARLGALLSDERHLSAAREAVRVLEYSHHWPGTWDRIDPGFDDDFGHYGERAVTMWEAWPEEPAFRDLALSGWRTYAPLWRLAVRHGGNVAADQVRCWHIAERIARLDPTTKEDVAALVDEAAQLHFRGGQAGDGVWVDVTIFGFDPQRLPVGDTAGVPHNLLEGLAMAHDPFLGLDTKETRARFWLALTTTDRAFAGEYGYISGVRRAVGAGASNPAIGSIRLLPSLVELFVRLEE